MRVRVRFAKLGKVRFTSHRDVARMWERALRRASVPVALTAGFSPRPRLSFGLALSTGYESVAEYLDIELAPGYEPELPAWPELLSATLPDGIDLLAAVALAERSTSLQQDVTSCTWAVEVRGVDPTAAAEAVAGALAAAEIVATRTRKGHEVTDDLRPAIVRLAVVGPIAGPVDGSEVGKPDGVLLEAELATQPRSLRPSELLEAVLPPVDARVVRTHQWIDHAGERTEPIGLDGAPHVLPLVGVGSGAWT